MTTDLRTLLDAYADAFEAHEQAVYNFAQAQLLHGGPRQRRNSVHAVALEAASARCRETSRAIREARGAILAALDASR